MPLGGRAALARRPRCANVRHHETRVARGFEDFQDGELRGHPVARRAEEARPDDVRGRSRALDNLREDRPDAG